MVLRLIIADGICNLLSWTLLLVICYYNTFIQIQYNYGTHIPYKLGSSAVYERIPLTVWDVGCWRHVLILTRTKWGSGNGNIPPQKEFNMYFVTSVLWEMPFLLKGLLVSLRRSVRQSIECETREMEQRVSFPVWQGATGPRGGVW